MWRKYLEGNCFCHYICCSIEAFLPSHLQKTQECRAIDGLSPSLASTCGHMWPPSKGWVGEQGSEGGQDGYDLRWQIHGGRSPRTMARISPSIVTDDLLDLPADLAKVESGTGVDDVLPVVGSGGGDLPPP